MATPCFYHSELTDQDTLIELSSSESAHLTKSRRLKSGHQVNVINGKGLTAAAEVIVANSKQVQIQCSNFIVSTPPLTRINVATAVPKGDRAKTMIDMLTQLGVSRVVPLRCDYSESRFNDKHRQKWQRVAIEACKQSQNPWLPQIETEWGLRDLLANLDRFNSTTSSNSTGFESTGFESTGSESTGSGTNNDDAPPQVIFANASGQTTSELTHLNRELIVLIGPEGGFSESELAFLNSIEATALSLGDHILRTELAAIAAVSQLIARTN